MNPFSSVCDDYYINLNLNTELDLPTDRETILHFFERIQKNYPGMRNFYVRENGDFVLEEDREAGAYRWVTVEQRRISGGVVNFTQSDEAYAQHQLILELAPYFLAVSPLDCEALDLLFGFDFTYTGNHDEVVADALGIPPALESLLSLPQSKVINYEPSLILALDEACRLQCRLNIETRTNAYQIRTGEFQEDQLSVYFTVRQYGGIGPDFSFLDSLARQRELGEEVVQNQVIPQVLRPLAQAIAAR